MHSQRLIRFIVVGLFLAFLMRGIAGCSSYLANLKESANQPPVATAVSLEPPKTQHLKVSPPAQVQALALPEKAGFASVKDLGAKGDGKTDDTAAFQTIFGQGKGSASGYDSRSIYIPNGVYLVSDTIAWGDKRKMVWGQSRDGVVIKLQDNSPAFQDPAQPKKVLQVEFGHGGQNFNQRLRNLTVDIGKGNPGAIGIGFHTNNGGGLYNVAVRSSDPQKRGHTGIRLDKPWPGPGYIHQVWVDGFDTGIFITQDQYSMTFEHITLTNQGQVGFRNAGNTVAIRDLKSENRVTALANQGKSALMALVDAQLVGQDPAMPAILNHKEGVLFARDVRTQGYKAAIENQSGNAQGVADAQVTEFVSHPAASLFPGTKRSLRLPIEDPPEIPYGDPQQWVSVADFGAIPNDRQDDGGAIQKALDSGARTVYLPPGVYQSQQSLRVRGKVERFFGLNAAMKFRVPGQSAMIVEDGQPRAVDVEIDSTYGTKQRYWLEHASKRTLHFTGGSYINSVPGGKVFMENIIATPLIFKRQKVWIRQANTESYENNPHIVNQGSDLWILGLKTEKDRTIIGTSRGGRTEVLGGLLYKNREKLGSVPAFINEDADVSLVYRSKGIAYRTQIQETQNGKTKALKVENLPASEGRMPLYIGYGKR